MHIMRKLTAFLLCVLLGSGAILVGAVVAAGHPHARVFAEQAEGELEGGRASEGTPPSEADKPNKRDKTGKRDKQEAAKQTEQPEKSEPSPASEAAETQESPKSSAKDGKSGAANDSEINERPAQPESDHIPESGGKSEPDDKNKNNGDAGNNAGKEDKTASEPFDPVQSLDPDLLRALEQAGGQGASDGAPEKQPKQPEGPEGGPDAANGQRDDEIDADHQHGGELFSDGRYANEQDDTQQEEEESFEDTHGDEALETSAAGDVALGARCELSGAPGGKVTLAISIDYREGERTLRSNRGAAGGIVSHPAKPVDVHQRIGKAIPEARVAILAAQEESFPLNKKLLRQEQSVVSGGVNAGYAVFAGARVRKDAVPGEHPLRLRVAWLDRNGEEHIKTLTARFTVLPGDDDGGDEELGVEADEVLEEAGEIMEAGEEADGAEGAEADEEADEAEQEDPNCDVALGSYDVPTVEAGDALTLALPILFERDGEVYRSNRGAQGGQIAFADGNSAESYDQSIAQAVSELWLSIDGSQPEGSPLAPGSYSAREIVSDGRNAGFAVFRELETLDSALPGEYPVRLTASWLEPDSEDGHSTALIAQVRVTSGAQAMSLDDGGIALGTGGWFDAPTGAATATLAVPISYTAILSEYNPDTDSFDNLEKTFATNAAAAAEGAQGGILPYSADTPIGAYDQQTITGLLSELSVEILDAQSSDCPLDLAIPQGTRALISGGNNNGYAVFEDVPLKPELAVGAYPVALRVAWENAEGVDRAETITLHMTISDGGAAPMLSGENGIIVFTHAQLKLALQNNVPGYIGHSFNPIYLGSCKTEMPVGSWETKNDGEIKYPTGVVNNADIAVTRSVTIIGTDPRTHTRLKVVDRPTGWNDGTLSGQAGIYANAAGITITVRDVNWQGHNYNGIVMGNSAGGTQFINVHYTGSRMYATSTANSWVSFSGCTAHITNLNASTERGQEVARGGDIRLYGYNKFTRDGYTLGLYHAMFWLCVGPNKLTVAAGANVDVETNYYFLRQSNPHSTTVAIDGALRVSVDSSAGGFTCGTESINNMTVSGSLKIEDSGSTYPTLCASSLTVSGSAQIECTASSPGGLKFGLVYVTGSVNVPGSLKIVDHAGSGTEHTYGTLRTNTLTVSGSLDIEQKQSLAKPCIRIQDHNSASFNSPKRVDLKAPGGKVILCTGTNGKITITTQVVNRWTSAGSKLIWNNNDLGSFSVSAGYNTSQTTSATPSGLTDNKGVALEAVELNSTNFNFGSTTRLLLGQYAASIDRDTVFYGSDVIRGTAPAGSTQTVREYDRSTGTPGTLRQDVAATGSSQYHTGDDWQPISSMDARIYLLTKLNDLEAHIYEEIQAALALYRVPPELDFGVIPVSGSQRTLPPTDDQLVQVVDTRSSGTWTLSLSATPMTSDGGDVLDGTLVFYSAEDVMTPLSESDSVFAAAKAPDALPGVTDVNWPQDCGIRLVVMPFEGEPGASYSATVTWTLEDA